jgi:Tol biopolymer transport system component
MNGHWGMSIHQYSCKNQKEAVLMRRILLVLMALVVGLSSVGLAQFFPPGLKWYTIETEHFSVTYHEGAEDAALQTAKASEEAWEYWTEKLQYAPGEKIEVVIVDLTDGPNGFANLVPNNQFVDFTSGAGFASGFSNSEAPTWEDLVGFHEYGHIADLDFVSGLSKTLRGVFGRIIVPGIAEPTLLIEGIPTYGEYEYRGASRANDARNAMMLRTMMLENNYPDYQEASFYYQRDQWPPVGSISHDVGPWFIRYLEDTYGTDTYRQLKVAQTSDPVWALGSLAALATGGQIAVSGDFNSVYKQVTGKSGDELWDEFQVWVENQFSEQVQNITEAGITPSRQLTDSGYSTGGTFVGAAPTWSPDGEWVYYNHNSPQRAGGIRRVRADGTGDEPVIQGAANWNMLQDGSGAIFTRGGPYEKFYGRNDLYHYDFETGKQTRLTEGARPTSIGVSPDGNTVVYARQNWGSAPPSLDMFDRTTGEITEIQTFPEDFQIENMSLSPDGNTIALSVYQNGGYSNVYTLPVGGGELTAITQNKATDMHPFWSPDGEYLMWSSDRTEVHNIYAHDVNGGQNYQVTNMLTGAFAPRVSPDGTQLLFTSYSSNGYDAHVMDIDRDAWTPVTLDTETIPEWEGYPSMDDYEVHEYSPVQSLMPKLWVPVYAGTQVGINTFSMDALFAQNYNVTVGWDLEAQAPYGDFFYSTTAFLPTVAVFGGMQSAGYYGGANLGYPLVVQNGLNINVSTGYQRSMFGQLSETFSANMNLNSNRSFDLFADNFNLSVSGMLNVIEGLDAPIQRVVASFAENIRIPVEIPNGVSLRFTAGWSDAPAPEMGYALGRGQFGLRGFIDPGQAGQLAAAGSAQYNFRITPIETGLGLWPVFFDDLGGSVFVDAGMAGSELDLDNVKMSFGFELNLSVALSYFGGPTFKIGIAQGIGEEAPQIYFGI